MQPVLGLVPNRAVRPVDHLVGDLVATVSRKAMQDNGFRVCFGQQIGVELERPERPYSIEPVVFLVGGVYAATAYAGIVGTLRT